MDAAVDGEVGRPRGLAHPVRDVARSEEASGLRSCGARPRAHDVGVAQRLVGPEAYVPGVVEVGRELHPHRGAVGLPGVLVLARPLEEHRAVRDRAGDEGRFERGVVGAVVPVAAGAGRVRHLHRFEAEVEGLRDRGSERVDPL